MVQSKQRRTSFNIEDLILANSDDEEVNFDNRCMHSVSFLNV